MLELDPQVLTALALGAAALSVLLLLLVLLLALRLRRLSRRHAEAFADSDAGRVVDLLGEHQALLQQVRGDLAAVETRTGELRELLRGTVSRVGLVRYDAFDDMGGALSFTAALLDERNDGLVISAINGRTETRCYAKPVTAGASEHNLSEEEETAIDAAIRGERVVAAPTPSRRRRRSS